MHPVRKRILVTLALTAALGAGGAYVYSHSFGSLPLRPGRTAPAPAPGTSWPWSASTRSTPHPGVTRWSSETEDGTLLDLVRFDFETNPGLRLRLYDQDQDDSIPGDDRVDYWGRGAGPVTRALNDAGKGRVVAAWNGSFFAAERQQWGKGGIAHHIGPVVLDGKVLYNVGNHRWTFGVREGKEGREFLTRHLPDRSGLQQFTYAASGVQCLVREGKPLRLRPFPALDEPLPKGPVPSTPEEAGFIPIVEHIRTSRTSLGWSRDHRYLYLLLVHEPDHETASTLALRRNLPVAGGWTVADLQRFWLSLGAWGAINLDGGNVTQATCLRPDGRYDLITPRWTSAERRRVFDGRFQGAPEGGTLMYFYVADTGSE